MAMRAFAALVGLAGLALAGPALADIRVCEATLSGPAGEHIIYLEVDGREVVFGEAVWAPPRQNARAGIEFPRLELNYGITDFDTGERTPLRYVEIYHALRMTQTRADTAEVTFGPFSQPGERRDWPFFAMARDPSNTGVRNSDVIGGNVFFSSRSALEAAQTAPQLETRVVTNLDEELASGVFLMVHRPALDAMFNHAFQQARQAAENPGRHCRGLRHDERARSQQGS